MNISELKNIQHQDPYRAFDLATEHLAAHPGELPYLHVQAHALVQTGSPNEAICILSDLYQAGHWDPETLGLLGRAWKEIGRDAASEAARCEGLKTARDYYRAGLEYAEANGDTGGCYPGINAAARFATDFRAVALRTVATIDFPEGVCLRIGLHAGRPVTAFVDRLLPR